MINFYWGFLGHGGQRILETNTTRMETLRLEHEKNNIIKTEHLVGYSNAFA